MTTPAGFVPVFHGWNVWAVLARNEPSFDVGMVGVSPERRLRIWVEQKADEAPGVNVADEFNPLKLKGEQVEIIPSAEGLEPALERDQEFPGSILNFDPAHTRVFVRFFNRGTEGAAKWPRDEDFFLDTVYAPDAENVITSGAEPGTLEGTAGAVASATGTVIKIALGVGLGLGLLYVLSRVASSRRELAA